MRRPDVDRYLQIEPGAGVVNVLSGRIPFAQAVMRWVDGGLDVLPAGPVPLNPSELLGSRAMAALLEDVRPRYDFVILDTPAVLPVADAAAVSARADGAVLVVRYGRTSEEQVSDAVGSLETVGAPLLGVVLTRTPGSRRRRRRGGAGAYPEPDPSAPRRAAFPAAQRGGASGGVTVRQRARRGAGRSNWRTTARCVPPRPLAADGRPSAVADRAGQADQTTGAADRRGHPSRPHVDRVPRQPPRAQRGTGRRGVVRLGEEPYLRAGEVHEGETGSGRASRSRDWPTAPGLTR